MKNKMGLNATWCMAVGGMIGGGIFSVLGVVVEDAGYMAWLSFLIAGIIALFTAISYSHLTYKFKEGGGAFTYIKDINHEHFAGGLSWLLIGGYVLTMSVYAFTFGNYLANVMGGGPWVPRFFAALIIVIFLTVNLRGVGDASWVEIITVWGKIAILLVLAAVGWQTFNFSDYTSHIQSVDTNNAILAAGSIFMAYEGFQLITYDYDVINNPPKTIRKAEILGVLAVIIIYIFVTIGTILLVGTDAIIEKKEVVIAIAGQQAFGTIGLIIATIGALFSTGSAINSTLFATGRLARKIATDHELPNMFKHENTHGISDRSIIFISAVSIGFALVGNLNQLVEGASFVFLFTFMIVNAIAFKIIPYGRFYAAMGVIGTFTALCFVSYNLLSTAPIILVLFIILTLIATVIRPLLLKNRKFN